LINDPIAQQLGWTSVNPYPQPLTEAEVISQFHAGANAFINDVSSGLVQFADDAARARFDLGLQRRNDYAVKRPNFGGDVYQTATQAANVAPTASQQRALDREAALAAQQQAAAALAAQQQAAQQGMLTDSAAASVSPVQPVPAATLAPTANVAPTASQTPSASLMPSTASGLLGLSATDMSNAPVSAPIMMQPTVTPYTNFNPRDAQLAGVDTDTYGNFLGEVNALNQAHRGGNISTDDYVRNYYSLIDQYGVNPVVRDGNRVLYLNPGIQFDSAQYDVSPLDRDLNPQTDGFGSPDVFAIDRGQSATTAQLYPGGWAFRGFENEPLGSFIGDTRTRNEQNLIRDIGMLGLNTATNLGIGSVLGAGSAALGLPLAPESRDGAGGITGGDVLAGAGAIFNPRIGSRPNNDRVVVDGERLGRSESADALMRDVLAGMMDVRERFDIPPVENTPPETIEFPIEMPRLPVEAEGDAEDAAGGGGGGSTDLPSEEEEADEASDEPDGAIGEPDVGGGGGAEEGTSTAPAPPEEVFGDLPAGRPDFESEAGPGMMPAWRWDDRIGAWVNVVTGERRTGDSPGGFIPETGTEESEAVDDDDISVLPDIITGGGDFDSDFDMGIDFGPFPIGTIGNVGTGSAVGGDSGTGSGTGSGDSGTGSGTGSGGDIGSDAGVGTGSGTGTGGGVGAGTGEGTGDGEGDGDGNGSSQPAPTISVQQQQKDFEDFMTQVRYQVQMMQRPEFMLRDYLAELLK
jgi:hypothetical protein